MEITAWEGRSPSVERCNRIKVWFLEGDECYYVRPKAL